MSFQNSLKVVAIILLANCSFASEIVEISGRILVEPAYCEDSKTWSWVNMNYVASKLCKDLGFEKAIEFSMRVPKENDFSTGKYLKYFKLASNEKEILELELTVNQVVNQSSGQAYLSASALGGADAQPRSVYFINDLAKSSTAMFMEHIRCKKLVRENELKKSQREWWFMSF